MAFNFINEQLTARHQQGLYRSSTVMSGAQGRLLKVADKTYLNFSSNDYLGLAADPDLIKAWQKGAELYGIGSGGSYLVTGFNQAHQTLCDQLKSWLRVEAVALFSSGYSANQAIIKLLLKKPDLLFQDKLNHASLMEAAALSDCKMRRFKHNDVEHLESLLTKSNRECTIDANKLIISEGVFSMDGDSAPVNDLLTKAKQHDAWLMIDDAHGIGVLGENGKGSAVAGGLDNNKLQIYMATFGKALGVGGAFVAGSKELINYINNFSKPYIYSTGLPPAMAYTITQAVKMAETQDWRRHKLNSLIRTFRNTATNLGISLADSQTAIQPIIIGDSVKTLQIADKLKTLGFWTTAIRPPTVASGTARLRITLTVNHQEQDVVNLVNAIYRVLNDK
ncbi:MAG: 8-amino-7-oxononanoate synthase [Psychromonas sp.]|jgi:8-amino-7-oxononanoate synthase|uniref:8-amino-7-oxononanoate synthase n=1 Tax=Psychromonas sp. TaxID=1884585 RepID=UPI0039E572B1